MKPHFQSGSMVMHVHSAIKWRTTHSMQMNVLSKNIENFTESNWDVFTKINYIINFCDTEMCQVKWSGFI